MSLASISRLSLRTACKSAASCSISRADFASSSRTAEAAASTITKKEVRSSCPPGTVFRGLNILKDEADPVSKPDEEYPEWLWSIIPAEKNAALAEKPKQVAGSGETFDFAAEKRRLKAINKAKIKASNFLRGT